MVKKYIMNSLSICVSILLTMLLTTGIIRVDILSIPQRIIIVLILLTIIAFTIYSYLNKKIKIYNIGVILSIGLNIILLSNIVSLNTKYDYIKNLFNNKQNYITYSVYVQRKTTTYSNIEKLEGKNIGMLNKNSENLMNYLKNIIDVKCLTYNTMEEIEQAIMNGEIQSFILTEAEYNELDKTSFNIMDKVRVIYTNKVIDTI